MGCLGDPQGREEAAQAEPRVSRPRDALPKTFPAWNFTPLSHGNSEDKPGGSPPVSAGAAGGSWQLLVAPGSSSARPRSHRALASPPCPGGPRGRQRRCRFLRPWGRKKLRGVSQGRTEAPPRARRRKEGDPRAPGLLPAPGAHGANPRTLCSCSSLSSPHCGISRSFLPTQRCCFSSALHPYLETVAWRQTPAPLMF